MGAASSHLWTAVESFNTLNQNPYFRGGLGLLVIQLSLGWVGFTYGFFYRHLKQLFTVTLSVTSRDSNYEWFHDWLLEQNYAKTTRDLTLETTYDNSIGDDDNPHRFRLVPGFGEHFFVYKGRWLWLSRENLDPATTGNERLQITALFTRDRQIVTDLLCEAEALAESRKKISTEVLVSHRTTWSKAKTNSKRSLDSVILRRGLSESLVADIKKFMADKDWYKSVGIPYRRGYLLHGPPGTGKTSFVMAVAGHFNMNICQCSLKNPQLDDESLPILLNNAPPRSIILMEDIDHALDALNEKQGLTLSGLLNAFDGACSQEGRIVFITTNNKEKLGAALIRPGRIDVKTYFGCAAREQMIRLFKTFFGEDQNDLAIKFSEALQEDTYSMAQLQGYLVKYKDSPKDAVKHLSNESWLLKSNGDWINTGKQQPARISEKQGE